MFSSLNTIFQFWRKFWQKFGTKNNNNNNKLILKIAYALHARDQKVEKKYWFLDSIEVPYQKMVLTVKFLTNITSVPRPLFEKSGTSLAADIYLPDAAQQK